MIPKIIEKNHIVRAIRKIELCGIPKKRKSTRYSLLYDGKQYPPKLVISLAHEFASGKKLNPEKFSGGGETNNFLRNLGFEVVELEKAKRAEPLSIKELEREDKGKHSERCPECKEKILRLLENIYGKVEKNYKFDIGTKPEDFQQTPYDSYLLEIYRALQNFRGHKEFVRAKTLPHCDFYVPNPGLIVEFDESQHFTKPRWITLKKYPKSLKLGFDRNIWIELCSRLRKKDNDPPFRDEQRAWYDTLRDFSASVLGLSIVRIRPDECVWCELDENSRDAVAYFKKLITDKFLSARANEQKKKNNGITIGLAFPELNKQDIDHFQKVIRGSKRNLDLLIFPEGYESLGADDSLEPEDVVNHKSFKEFTNRYIGISSKLNLSIIVGVSFDYRDASISGGGNDQYCLFVTPRGDKALYHKHSSSKYTAFYDDYWSIEKNFKVLGVGDKKIGISICHDSYISLIPRILKTKQADIWVNISFQNVRSHIWEAILKARSTENGMISVCTLHRNSKSGKGKGRPQKEPYAYSERGKIKLKDLEKNIDIDEISPDRRTGRIYYFCSSGFETYPNVEIEESSLSPKADAISIDKKPEGNFEVKDGEGIFVFEDISLKDFIYCPEKIWKLSLKRRGKITFFVVWADNVGEWRALRSKVENIIKARIIEFSTLFIFMDKERQNVLLAGYRSSNYKDSRIFSSKKFPFQIDRRFLKGMESIYGISLDDRGKNIALYFERIIQIINFLS